MTRACHLLSHYEQGGTIDRVEKLGEHQKAKDQVDACRNCGTPHQSLHNRVLHPLEQLLHLIHINLPRSIMLIPHHLLHPCGIRVTE